MTIQPVSSSPPGHIDLTAFAEASKQAGDAYVTVSGQKLHVLGAGATPGGRSVAWVAPGDDTVAMFTDALSRAYSPAIARAVAKELSLSGCANAPLSTAKVNRAIEMAELSRRALEGVDFGLRMDCLASSGAKLFKAACAQAGVRPDSLDGERRQAIDAAMQKRFEDAAAARLSPVSPDTAQAWLLELISSHSGSGTV